MITSKVIFVGFLVSICPSIFTLGFSQEWINLGWPPCMQRMPWQDGFTYISHLKEEIVAENAKKSGFYYGYLIVVTCLLLCIGPSACVFSAAGICYTPVSEWLGVGKGVFAMYMTILCLTMTVTLPIWGKIIDKYDARIVLTICAVLVVCGFVLMAISTQIWMFYIAGLLLGGGEACLLYLATPTLINRWFKKNAGLFIGICMAGTGIGGIILNMVGGNILADGGESWRNVYWLWAAISAICSLPFTIFVVRSNPADKGLQPYGADEVTTPDAVSGPVVGVSAKVAMRSPVFYGVCLISALIAFDTVIYQYLPSYATAQEAVIPALAAVSATLASAAMFGQLLGKIGLGWVNDRSVLMGLTVGCVAGVVGMLLMWLVPTVVPVVLVGGFIFGIYYAASTVQMPLLTSSIFGQREYSSIYSRVSMLSSLGAAFAATLWGFIIEAVGYNWMFVIGIILTVCVWLVGAWALSAGKKLPQTTE